MELRALELPVRRGGHYFYLHNDGSQNLNALMVTERVDVPGRVLFDPNTASADATVALNEFTPPSRVSWLPTRCPTAAPTGGSGHFRRVRDGVDLDDTLRFTKYWGVAWAHDASGVLLQPLPGAALGPRGG